jgi:hypothetical protein
MLKSIVNELRLIKSILLKSNKFIKSSKDFSFKNLYNFIVLRYFYIRPFFRFLIKGKKITGPKKIIDDYLQLNLDIETALNDLKSNAGYSTGYKISQNVIDQIINYYTTDKKNIEPDTQLRNFLSDNNLETENLIKKNNEDFETYIQRIIEMGTHQIRFADRDLNHNSILNKLTHSEPLIKLAQNYLNSKNINIINEMVISLPTRKNIEIDILKQSSQTFHRDLVSKNFFKAFIFLSDVNKNDGSHVYLEGSHQKNFNDEVNKDDLSIETLYKDCKKKEIYGKKGDLFFGDTFCLHKGSNPKNNYRLLLILTFFTGTSLQTQSKKNITQINI